MLSPSPVSPTSFTAQPSLTRRFWALSWPAMISGLSVPLVGLVDASIVGRLPQMEAVGAVGLAAWLFDMIFWSVGFLRMGTTGLTAQARGRAERVELIATLLRGLALALALGLLILSLSWLALTPSLLALSGGERVITTLAHSYLSARLWGGPAALINYVLLGWLLGMGRPRLALLLQLSLNLTNVALSALWGLEWGWGLIGVGAASAAAQWVAALLGGVITARLASELIKAHPHPKLTERGETRGLTELTRKDKAALKGALKRALWAQLLSPSAWRALMRVSGDLFVRTALLLGVFGALNAVSARLGALTLSATTLLLHLQTLQAFALDGFAHGAEVLVGEAVGAKDQRSLRATLRVGWRLTMGVALLISVCYLLFSSELLTLLNSHKDLLAFTSTLSVWAALSPLISAPSFLLDGVMIGATKTREMRVGMSLSALTFVSLLGLSLSSLGAHGLWLAFMGFMLMRALTLAPATRSLLTRISSPQEP